MDEKDRLPDGTIVLSILLGLGLILGLVSLGVKPHECYLFGDLLPFCGDR